MKNIRQLKTTKPLVSVIMPAFNAEKYVVAAIESIMQQTYQNFEFIIVDDNSNDSTPAILKQYAQKYPKKIRVITMDRTLNGGGDKCANEAAKVARGTYIARMDADDIAHPMRLEKQVAFLEAHKDIYLVGSNADVIDGSGKVIGEKLEPETTDEIYSAYASFHPLIHPTCMIRRVVDGVPFAYNIAYPANNDYNTFFTLLCKGYKFYNLQEKLLFYRIHGKNDTFVRMKQKFTNTWRIRLAMITKYGYKPSFKAIVMTFVQAAVVYLVPEKALTGLYCLAKGITKPTISLPTFTRPNVVTA